jgi:hypothetical protein
LICHIEKLLLTRGNEITDEKGMILKNFKPKCMLLLDGDSLGAHIFSLPRQKTFSLSL